MDWSNPLVSPLSAPIGEIAISDYTIPVIPLSEKLFSKGIRNKGIKAYALACFLAPPNGKRIPAEYMIDMAVKTGLIKPGGILVEPTSGGMGAAMAFCAKKYDITLHAIVSDSMPDGKLKPQTDLGAIVLRESEVARILGLERSPGSQRLAELYAKKIGGVFLNQYHNPWNPESWETLVAPKVWDLFEGTLSAAFFGLGSGGTMRGLGGYLKKHGVTIVATMPYFSQEIAGLRDQNRLKEVAEWKHVPDYFESIDADVARARSSKLFPAGESSGAIFGMFDHYYLDRVERGELAEKNVAIMPFMDTFVPYLQIG